MNIELKNAHSAHVIPGLLGSLGNAHVTRKSAGARSVVYLFNDPTMWFGLFFQFSHLNFRKALTTLISEKDSNQCSVKSAVDTLIQNRPLCIS